MRPWGQKSCGACSPRCVTGEGGLVWFGLGNGQPKMTLKEAGDMAAGAIAFCESGFLIH